MKVIVFHCSRRRATLGRNCSAGRTLFFEAQSLGMGEAPDLHVIDLHAPFGQLTDETPKGEVLPGPIQKPTAQIARQQTRLV